VKEAISVLKGEFGGDLLELCLTIGSLILVEGGFAEDTAAAREKLLGTIADGSALKKLADMVEAQFGDPRAVYDTSLLPEAKVKLEAVSNEAGYVAHMAAEEIGLVSMHLGGGRATKESEIDLSVGVVLHKKVGDYVAAGESLATVHAASVEAAEQAADMLRSCYTLTAEKAVKPAFIKAIIR